MPRRSAVALLLAVAITSGADRAAAAPDGPVVVDDDFESATLADGWAGFASAGPGPVVDDGRVTQGEASNFWENLVWSEPAASDAVWIEVDVVDAALPVMLVLHHDGDASEPAENNGYGMRWQPGNQRVTILEDGEYRGPHATSGGSYSGPHTLRAEWDGVDQITFFVDGEPVMEWTDEDGVTLGGPERRRVAVMFPPTGSAVYLDAVRGGSLDAPAADPPPPAAVDSTPPPTAASPATSAPAAPVTMPPSVAGSTATDAPVVTDNAFVPERDLSDCVSAVPQPNCGSDAKGGWRQALVFALVVVALAFVAWRITRTVRRNRRKLEAPGGR